ncbi:hypothetical protein PVK06_020162 [Gossypium arboreum]|uniref:CCHC-type domain-containing protein n=1 Tax=Gossypium arboreum TaxID=29729 RepID=A0ABR0PM65_GOSAR|nr:hypothetical protein PVK06_020162 [Gossypium arboreum]
MRLNEGAEEEKVMNKKIEMFARRFKRFMKSNKGIRFQKMEELKLKYMKEKDLIICYECKKLGYIKFDCPQWKKKGPTK